MKPSAPPLVEEAASEASAELRRENEDLKLRLQELRTIRQGSAEGSPPPAGAPPFPVPPPETAPVLPLIQQDAEGEGDAMPPLEEVVARSTRSAASSTAGFQRDQTLDCWIGTKVTVRLQGEINKHEGIITAAKQDAVNVILTGREGSSTVN